MAAMSLLPACNRLTTSGSGSSLLFRATVRSSFSFSSYRIERRTVDVKILCWFLCGRKDRLLCRAHDGSLVGVQEESEEEEDDDDEAEGEEEEEGGVPERWDVLGIGQAMVSFSSRFFSFIFCYLVVLCSLCMVMKQKVQF